MIIRIFLAILVVAAIVGAIVYTKLGQFQAMGDAQKTMVIPPETVNAADAKQMTWEQTLESTGTLAAVQGVVVSAEAGGRVKRIGFEAGVTVKAGDVLLELDTASEDAQLASARSSLALAQSNLSRTRRLAKRQLVSRAEVDNAAAQAKAARAQVNVVQASIKRKSVVAPFDGQLGLRQVNLGQILREGDPIVSLQTMDPIHADFSIPQQYLHELKPGMPVRLTTDAAPGKVFNGELLAISPQVDPVTRNIKVQAQLANPENLLRAGMFARIEVLLPEQQQVVAIPSTAIQYATFGDSVFVIKAEKSDNGEEKLVLEQRFVRLGQARGDFMAIVEGLEDGDRVVSSGVFKLRTGMTVVIDNTLAPKPSVNPRPPRS